MKKIITLILIVCNSILIAQEPAPAFYALEEALLIGEVDKSGRITIELDKDKLLSTMNHYMSKGKLSFDSVYIDTIDFDQKKFYAVVFKAKSSNKALVRWLSLRGTSLIIENTGEEEYKALNTYFMCEGEQSCYPRLKKAEGHYYWSCRDLDGCVSEAYAKEHPCNCTKSLISK